MHIKYQDLLLLIENQNFDEFQIFINNRKVVNVINKIGFRPVS